MDTQTLKQLGLTEYEVDLYLSLLSHGQLSAYELAEKAGLYRQVTYDTLKRLEEKGFVHSMMQKKTKLFQASNPQLILEMLQEKVDSYAHILPQLMGLSKSAQEPLHVESYKGKNIVRIALRDIINHLKRTKGEVLCTAVDESTAFSKYKTIVEQYERDLIHYGITERVLIREGTRGMFNKGSSMYKQIPVEFFNPNPVQIYGSTVQILTWGNPDYLIIIRSKVVADAYRKQFEFMWKFSKTARK